MEIRPLTETERKYTYTQSTQIMGQTGCIGHLRGDFDRMGTGFFTTWNDHWKQYKTDEFKRELDDVINALRSEKYGLLQNRVAMRMYAGKYPESSYDETNVQFGFRVDTDTHSFLLRCKPAPGEYDFYCYCYVKKWLDGHIQNAEKGIRFIDSGYNELFCIADGEKIVITDSSGKTEERICRYIDEYHTQIGSEIYHICQFAEIMERGGCVYTPKEDKKPKISEEAEKETLVYHSEYTGDNDVRLDIQIYYHSERICLGLVTEEDGYPEPFADLTVCIDAPTPNYCGYLDTNNLPGVEKFVTENGLGKFTGLTAGSGYCEYPLYLFDAEKLRKLCPEQMADYERAIGVTKKEPEKERSR